MNSTSVISNSKYSGYVSTLMKGSSYELSKFLLLNLKVSKPMKSMLAWLLITFVFCFVLFPLSETRSFCTH